MKQLFLSCDWGTSSFRLRLINGTDLRVLTEITTDDGILKTYKAWEQSGQTGDARLDFYRALLSAGITQLQSQGNDELNSLPVIISGMASANIGLKELSYKALPVFTDGTGLLTELIPADENCTHDILLVSGVRTETDVMRGEEIQLVGALEDKSQEQVVIFPGTHSKHVHVANGQIQDITTYMTGEFFELLSQKSILAGSVERDMMVSDEQSREAFRKGVEAGSAYSLLHSSFMARTNQLFGRLSKAGNYFYLSGLLIGTEMKELAGLPVPVMIVADHDKKEWYAYAAELLGLQQIDFADANTALLKGHTAMYKRHFVNAGQGVL